MISGNRRYKDVANTCKYIYIQKKKFSISIFFHGFCAFSRNHNLSHVSGFRLASHIWILFANQISCSSVAHFLRKMRWYLAKIQSCTIVLLNNFEILQVSIAFFSDTVRLRNLKIFLYINPYGYSLQTKFYVPRLHTFWEKCDDNLKLASHFSPILCDRGTWNFFCILTHMDTLCKPNFMFLGRTLFEKNAMITCKNSNLHNCPNKQLWNFTS